jgi:hypothetical protein
MDNYYVVEITETFTKRIAVKATTENAALMHVRQLYTDNKIQLTEDDLVYSDIHPTVISEMDAKRLYTKQNPQTSNEEFNFEN